MGKVETGLHYPIELDQLPSCWHANYIGVFCQEIQSGFACGRHSDEQIGVPHFRPMNVSRLGLLDFDVLKYVAADFDQRRLSEGDVLFNNTNSPELIGKTAYVDQRGNGCAFSNHMTRLLFNQAMDPRFGAYQLHFLWMSKYFLHRCVKHVNQASVSSGELGKTVSLVAPPLAEQHRIVAKIEELFSELDQGVASLKTARAQIKVYRQSLLKNAFEGKLTAVWRAAHPDQLETAAALQQRIAHERQARYQQQLADWQTAGQTGPKPKPPKPLPPLTAEELAELPELPAGWVWFKVGEICDSIVPNRDKPKSFSGDIPWITTPCLCSTSIRICYDKAEGGLTPEEANRFGAKVIPVNSVVMTCVGTFGLGAIVEKPLVINQQLHAFLWSPVIDPRFLAYRVQAGLSYFEKSSTSTTIQYLNKEKCNSLPIPICCLEEQRNVVEELESKLSEADQLDQTLATALQQADALRQSILKKAFSGQLVKQDKNEEPATALLERIRAKRATSPAKGRQAKMLSKSLTNY